MIRTEQVIPLLLEACPGFNSAFQEHRKWWKGEDPGIYNDLGSFADYLVNAYERKETLEVTSAFEVIEKFICEGDQNVRHIAIVGILEDVRNIASHRSCGNKVFVPFLRKYSLAGWQELERVWNGKRNLAEVVREELKKPDE